MDLAAYRASAEAFTSELTLEYYRHFAGLKPQFEIEAVYDRHPQLFAREAVDDLREAHAQQTPGSEARRALRVLLGFAVEGHLGQATKAQEAELARLEAETELELDGAPLGFRESSIEQANEPDPERRARIETARNEVTERLLTPVATEMLGEHHRLARELGWASYQAMSEELSGIDLGALGAQTAAFLAATRAAYPGVAGPAIETSTGVGFGDLRRSDLPRFFRAPEHDGAFPADRLIASFEDTMTGLGIDVARQPNVFVDVERRRGKSPRAFCAPVRVPDEVHLVVPPIGGRDDYFALLHEAGHTQHYAHVDPGLAWEFRALGDNSVTEGFAFLFDHLVEDPEWLARRLEIEDAAGLAAHARAQQLVYMRRYAAKLGYELRLHGDGFSGLEEAGAGYASALSDALEVRWPAATFLTDVDPGFYAACYLRAWALESHLRRMLRERFGPAWFDEPEAGETLRGLWSGGQRLDADELLAEITGEELDFGAMLGELGLAPG